MVVRLTQTPANCILSEGLRIVDYEGIFIEKKKVLLHIYFRSQKDPFEKAKKKSFF